MQNDNNETNSKISNELTIEPGLGGSLLNAGFVTGANVGKSLPLMSDVETEDEGMTPEEIARRRQAQQERADKHKRNQAGLVMASIEAVTGISMESLIPRKYTRPSKPYTPKYDPDRAAIQQAHNFALDQARAAKKAYKKSVPRSERVLPKGK